MLQETCDWSKEKNRAYDIEHEGKLVEGSWNKHDIRKFSGKRSSVYTQSNEDLDYVKWWYGNG